MGMGNIGLGLSSAAEGFQNGYGIACTFVDSWNRHKVNKAREEGIKEADADRDTAISKQVQTTTLPDGAQFYSVGKKNYDNLSDAREDAAKNVPSRETYFDHVVVPKVRDQYLAQGRTDMADQWTKYASDGKARRGLESYQNALQKHVEGDDEGALREMIKAHNNEDYNGGRTVNIDSFDPIKDAKGNTIGHTAKYTDSNGRQFSQNYRSGDIAPLLQQAITLLHPASTFSTSYAQQTAADKAAADAAVATLKGRQARELAGDKQAGAERIQDQRDAASARLHQMDNDAAADRDATGIQLRAGADANRTADKIDNTYQALTGLGMSKSAALNAAAGIHAGKAGESEGAKAYDTVYKQSMDPNPDPKAIQAQVANYVNGRNAAAAQFPGIGGAQPQPDPDQQPSAQQPGLAPVYDP